MKFRLITLLFPAFLHAQVFATISGMVVVAGSQQTVSGVLVSAHPADSTPALDQPIQATSSASGAFQLTFEREGRYRICPQLPASPYVNECLWGFGNVIVQVTRGLKLDSLLLPIRRGAPIEVRLDDPGNKLAALKPSVDPGVQLAIQAPGGLFHPIARAAQDSNGRTHRIVVPWDTDVKVFIRPGKLTVRDNNGRALAQSERIPFRRNADQGDASFAIRLKVD